MSNVIGIDGVPVADVVSTLRDVIKLVEEVGADHVLIVVGEGKQHFHVFHTGGYTTEMIGRIELVKAELIEAHLKQKAGP